MARRPNDEITGAITDTLFDMMRETPFERITVKDLVARAGVGRASFYRNFESKEDVVARRLDAITDDFIARMDFDFRRDSHRFYVMGLFVHLDSHRDIIELLRANGLLHLIKDEFDRAFLKRAGVSTPVYACYMAAGAYYNLFYYWAKNGYKETPEELSRLEFRVRVPSIRDVPDLRVGIS